MVGWLVGVKLMAREKTSRLIFMKFSERIYIRLIRTRKIAEFKNTSLFFTYGQKMPVAFIALKRLIAGM